MLPVCLKIQAPMAVWPPLYTIYSYAVSNQKMCVFAGPQAQSLLLQNAFEKNFHIACKQNKQRFLNFSTNQNGCKQSKQ